MTNQNELTIKRIFNAPIERVWKAWTDPEGIKHWWGPKDFTAPFAEVDLRVGGKYLYAMRGKSAPDVEERDYWSGGVFLEVDPMKRIVMNDYFTDEKGNRVPASHYGMSFEFPEDMKVEVGFKELPEGKTELTLYYPDRGDMPEADRVGMEMGWNQSLDKLEEYLKTEQA